MGAYALRGMGRMIINEVPKEWSMHSHTQTLTHALHCLQISRSTLHHLHVALQPFVLNSGYCQFQRQHTTTQSVRYLAKLTKMCFKKTLKNTKIKRERFKTDFPTQTLKIKKRVFNTKSSIRTEMIL